MPAEDPERWMYLGFIKVGSLTSLSLISVPFMSAPFTSKHRSAPRPAVPRKMYPLPTIATEAFLAQSLSTLNRDLALNNFSVEELDYLGGALHAAVNRRRNSLLPVQNAPVEVLERIFQFVVAPLPLEDQMRARKPPQIAWAISLAQVCSHWRTIVLHSPNMWYHVVDDSGRFVSRPRDMNPNIPREVTVTSPLHVYMTLLDNRFPHSVRPLDLNMDGEPYCIEQVYLRIDRHNHQFMIDASLSTPLPAHVKLLAITSTRDSVRPDGWSYPRELPLVFRGDTPNLRALVADAYAPFLPGNAFPNLVNLRVSCLPHMALGFTLLLELFSNTPRLETLELLLHPTGPRGYEESMTATDGTRGLAAWKTPVPLPRLRALTMSGLYLEVAMTMLSKLDVPSNVVMRLFRLQLAPHTTDSHTIPTLPIVPAIRDLRGLTHMDIFDGVQDVKASQQVEQDCQEEHYRLDAGRVALGRMINAVSVLRHLSVAVPQPQMRRVEREAEPADIRYSFYAIGRGPRSGLWIHVEAPLVEGSLADYVQSGVLQSLQRELPLGDVTTLRMSVLPDRFSCLPAMVSRMSSLTELVLRSASELSSAQAAAALQDISRALTPVSSGVNTTLTPAPSLEAVSLEVVSDYVLPTSLVNMAERRVIGAVPLVSMTCNISGAPQPELLRLSEHVIDDVDLTQRSLRWDPAEVLTLVWMATNEYWAMHPRPHDKKAWSLPQYL